MERIIVGQKVQMPMGGAFFLFGHMVFEQQQSKKGYPAQSLVPSGEIYGQNFRLG